MEIREYWTKRFKNELGELNEDDKEVLLNTIVFHETIKKSDNLF